MLKKIVVIMMAIILGIIALTLWATDYFTRTQNIPSLIETAVENNNPQDVPQLTVIAEELEVPWDLAFLPDGNLLVTERNGSLRKVDTKTGQKTLVATIDDVLQNNESGLHGITLDPDFENNGYVYLYYTYAGDGGNTLNRVVRYTYKDDRFTMPTYILDKIPGAGIHDGGRIRFGPDGYLYIAAGDASEPSLAQNTDSLAGKILRVTRDGNPAPGNPFGNHVYSYGHRNPQGLTWDNEGNLWAPEHGPTAQDELNFIEMGNNYGWPTITGNQTRQGMITPVIQSGSSTWAPSGTVFHNGSIFFVGLRSNTLFEAVIEGDQVTELKEHLSGDLGRLRGIIVGPDNMLYITTSNRDGRGIRSQGDDKVIRVNPDKL